MIDDRWYILHIEDDRAEVQYVVYFIAALSDDIYTGVRGALEYWKDKT